MNTILAKFASRKFLAFAGTLLTLTGAVLHGDTTWAQVVWPAVLAFLGYAGIRGRLTCRVRRRASSRQWRGRRAKGVRRPRKAVREPGRRFVHGISRAAGVYHAATR